MERDYSSSLFVFAGAGSGKTYTLIQILKDLKSRYGDLYVGEGRHIAVITYTNAAVDEINARLDYDPLFKVSTIHSFIWETIRRHQYDIKIKYVEYLENKISTLDTQIKNGSKSKKIKADIEKYAIELEGIRDIKEFSYDPNGSNQGKQSLSHSIVIELGSSMLKDNRKLQKIIAGKYPFILVDESQDTNKKVVDALLSLQEKEADNIRLIMVGDQKQRIYSDGKDNLANEIPKDWKTHNLSRNYRSAKRIVDLGNAIASELEEKSQQEPKNEAATGVVRLFICDTTKEANREKAEFDTMQKMAELTKEEEWRNADKVKMLILEHMMAAKRLGIERFWSALSKFESYDISFLQGSVGVMSVFKDFILPLYDTLQIDDQSVILRFLKEKVQFEEVGVSLKERKKRYQRLVNSLSDALKKDATLKEVLTVVKSEKVFDISSVLMRAMEEEKADESGIELPDEDEEVLMWRSLMNEPISTVVKYYDYVNDRTSFGTHQGVKGREFDQVMCIIDDENSKGFLFKFDKMFGTKELSDRDKENQAAGKDDVYKRTLRLFYVICTRAKKSLAVVVYTDNPAQVKATAIKKGWFEEGEIELIDTSKHVL